MKALSTLISDLARELQRRRLLVKGESAQLTDRRANVVATDGNPSRSYATYPAFLANSVDAIVANLTKFRVRLSVRMEQAKAHIQREESALKRLEVSVAAAQRVVQESLRAWAKELRKFPASSRDVIGAANARICEFGAPFSLRMEQANIRRLQIQKTLKKLGESIVEGLREAVRAREKHLRKVVASSRDAIVVTNGKITRLGVKQAKVHLQQLQNTITKLGGSVDRPQNLRARERDLRKLLTSSLDAVIVTSVNRRLISANQKALSLFGISETNMTMFSLDAFFSRHQVLSFDETGVPFISRREKRGQCEIKRMDGSLQTADYIFIPNYMPFVHLCRFRSDSQGRTPKTNCPLMTTAMGGLVPHRRTVGKPIRRK